MSITSLTSLAAVSSLSLGPSSARQRPLDASNLAVADTVGILASEAAHAIRTNEQTLTMLQQADGGADQVADILQEMRDLVSSATDESLSGTERSGLEAEFDALVDQLDEVVDSTRYQTQRLLDGSLGYTQFQIAPRHSVDSTVDVDFRDLSSSELGLEDVSLSDAAYATDALLAMDRAIRTVDAAQADLSAASETVGEAYLDDTARLQALSPAAALASAQALAMSLSGSPQAQSAGLSLLTTNLSL